MNKVQKIIDDLKKKKEEKAKEIKETSPPVQAEVKPPVQEEKIGLNQRIAHLEETIETIAPKKKEGKMKKWKLPWSKRANLKKMAKRNMVLVHLLKENRTTTFSYAEIRDGMVLINEKWRECALDFVWLLEGKRPEIILPEDSLQPIGTADFHKRLEDGSSGAYAEKIIIRALERAENEDKKKMGAKWIWIIIGAIIVVGFLLFYNQKK